MVLSSLAKIHLDVSKQEDMNIVLNDVDTEMTNSGA